MTAAQRSTTLYIYMNLIARHRDQCVGILTLRHSHWGGGAVQWLHIGSTSLWVLQRRVW